jgi:hypothetical protein
VFLLDDSTGMVLCLQNFCDFNQPIGVAFSPIETTLSQTVDCTTTDERNWLPFVRPFQQSSCGA